MPKLFNRISIHDDAPILEDYFDPDEEVFDPELDTLRKEFLAKLTEDQISYVELRDDVYHDDHQPCIDVDVTFKTGDVLTVAIKWSDVQTIGAFMYSDSQQAKRVIVDTLRDI